MLIKFLDGTTKEFANLSGADLSGADLRWADLSGADLSGADLINCKGFGQFIRCPQVGEFIGYKKLSGDLIATLLIPADAERVNCIGSFKCRASKVKVLSIHHKNNPDTPLTAGWSTHDPNFIYEVGREVVPYKYDPSYTTECSGGIHFFMTKLEAKEY